MNKILKLAICTGITFPFIASAQVVVSGTDTSTTPTLSTSPFHNLIIAMTNDSASLYTPESGTLSVSSPIYFNYDNAPIPTPGFTNPDWSASMDGTADNSIEFVHIPNFPGFNFAEGGSLDIGFIGEESINDNRFGFVEGGNYTRLTNWNAGGDTAPISYQLTNTAATSTTIMFRQNNASQGGTLGVGMQNEPNRFRIYGVLEDGETTGEYLFALADRDATKDADYDDGFYYLIGDITPVPEPSHIAALAMLGLGGLLYIRRRIRK